MKNYRIALIIIFLAALAAPVSSCKTKSGCEATESLKAKTTKDGQLKGQKHREGLFPKKMSKKMK